MTKKDKPLAQAPQFATHAPPVLIVNKGNQAPEQKKLGIDDIKQQLGLGFDRIEHIPGSTYRDSSTVIIVPERTPFFHQRVVQAWQNLIAPMNSKRCFIFVTNEEVGKAYTNMIQHILADKELSTWKYILTLESDNIPPPDAHIRLLETIEAGNYDAVSGIYFTRGEINMPQAYGDPDEYRRTGVLSFKPRDIRAALQKGQIMDVNGIAMGCALWRIDMFRQIEPPWFVTVNDVVPGKGIQCFTQDLGFCSRAVAAGKRFAVDMRCRVGHMDLVSGVIY
jgi:hypothetical protein